MIGTILLGLGLFLLLVFLILLVRRISYYSRDHKFGSAPRGASFVAIFFVIILLAASWVFFRAASDFRGFRPFKPLTKVCLIDVAKTADPVKSLRVILYTLEGDSLKENPEFFLSGNSWGLGGQYIRLTGYIQNLFPDSLAYKLNDFYGDYIGQADIEPDQVILVHQALDGGAVDLGDYSRTINFLKSSIRTEKFETQTIEAGEHNRYWLALSDSGAVSLEMVVSGK